MVKAIRRASTSTTPDQPLSVEKFINSAGAVPNKRQATESVLVKFPKDELDLVESWNQIHKRDNRTLIIRAALIAFAELSESEQEKFVDEAFASAPKRGRVKSI